MSLTCMQKQQLHNSYFVFHACMYVFPSYQNERNVAQNQFRCFYGKIDGETVETVRYFIFLGSKITADSDYSHEIKRLLLCGRKAMTNLWQHIKKQRHYFANKGPSSQSYGFSSSHVWMWELDYKESWVPKNWCFELWCWRRLLRVPWPARRSNQSILKEISPEYSLEGLMLKLKLQYFGHLLQRADSFKKTLMLGKIEGERRRGWQRMVGWHHWLNGREFV